MKSATYISPRDGVRVAETWASNLSGIGLTPGSITFPNSFELFVDADEFLGPMVDVIDSAEKTLSFQFLNMEADDGGRPIGDALVRAAKRGVAVKGILDYVSQAFETNGEITFWPWTRMRPDVRQERRATDEMFREMCSAGVQLKAVFPWFRNGFNRNHRKSIIADQETMIVGGYNPTDHNRLWHEVCARMRGPIAFQAERVFNEQFVETGFQAMPLRKQAAAGAGDVTIGLAINEPRRAVSIRDHFVGAVDLATQSIRVENSYFADTACFDALARAAKRGLTVQLIVPRVSNHGLVDRRRDRLLPSLADAGVDIYLYREMTHAKLALFDDVLISLGSANFMPHSLRSEREMNVVAVDPTGRIGAEIGRRVFEADIQNSDRFRSNLHI